MRGANGVRDTLVNKLLERNRLRNSETTHSPVVYPVGEEWTVKLCRSRWSLKAIERDLHPLLPHQKARTLRPPLPLIHRPSPSLKSCHRQSDTVVSTSLQSHSEKHTSSASVASSAPPSRGSSSTSGSGSSSPSYSRSSKLSSSESLGAIEGLI